MTLERQRQLNAILDQAMALEPSERSELLDRACQGDLQLRTELEQILALEAKADGFLAEPLADLRVAERSPPADQSLEANRLPKDLPDRPPQEAGESLYGPSWETEGEPSEHDGGLARGDSWIGRKVGPYRIEAVLGYGGMGAVYRAVRVDEFEQRVALKLVRKDAGSVEILKRFYAERQILAQLEHPGIARLLDGGTTDDGLPYFAMEFVDGQPIDRYCDRHQLPIRRRLDLFRQVCAAVHFAHQNLIVHRDLKPSNILVTADGSPRLLDFGIAKILQSERSPAVAVTQPGQSPMTPLYASPEQMAKAPITTSSDVYSLGVLLYRLLTGRHPYPLRGRSYQEIVDLVCAVEPTRPSLAVRQAAAVEGAGRGSARRLEHQLAGDLDAIVAKAMRKEPHHRYGSAAELAEDLRRHRVGLPVLARQGTWVYYTGKFLRRNKLALIAVLMIVGFAATATVLWRQAVSERQVAVAARAQAEHQQMRAEREQMRALRVTEFLEELFRTARPDENRGRSLTVLEALERGRAKVEEELVEEPEIRAEIFGTLGAVYGDLGLYHEAAELMTRALEVRRQSDSSDRSQLAKDISNLASSLFAAGDYEGASEYFREAFDMRRRLGQGGAEISVTLHNLAATLGLLRRYQEAEQLHRQNLAIRLRVYGPDSPEAATTYYSIGGLQAEGEDFAVAEPLLRRALDIRTAVFGPDHTRVADVLITLGTTLHAAGRHGEARRLLESALSIRLRRLGEDHSKVAVARKNLAAILLDQGEVEAAGRLLRQALATFGDSMAADSFSIADTRRLLGTYHLAQHRFDQAEDELLISYRLLRTIRGEDALPTRSALRQLVALYDAWGRVAAADQYRALSERQ